MFNALLDLRHDPQEGWDPISERYAHEYASRVRVDDSLVEAIESWTGGVAGKKLLDLGSGPGHYAVAFAQRGARVTCHDVSAAYLRIAQDRARRADVDIAWSRGFLEDARRFVAEGGFDVVFNSRCFAYARDDRRFARLLVDLTRPGGVLAVETTLHDPSLSPAFARPFYALNRVGIKIGHPWPAAGKVERLLRAHQPARIEASRLDPRTERVLFQKEAHA